MRPGFGDLERVQEAQFSCKCSSGLVQQAYQLRPEYQYMKACSEQPRGLPMPPCLAVLRCCLVQLFLPSEATEFLPVSPFSLSFVSPHQGLSGALSGHHSFLSGKISRSIHTLAFSKEKVAFLLYFLVLNIFPLCLGTSGRH